MEMSSQLHASAALPPIPLGYEVGWAPDPVWITFQILTYSTTIT